MLHATVCVLIVFCFNSCLMRAFLLFVRALINIFFPERDINCVCVCVCVCTTHRNQNHLYTRTHTFVKASHITSTHQASARRVMYANHERFIYKIQVPIYI